MNKYYSYTFLVVFLTFVISFQNCGKLESLKATHLSSNLSTGFTVVTFPAAYSSTNEFTFESTSKNKTPTCKLDSIELEVCESPLILDSISEGVHIFQIFLGNEKVFEHKWVYDKTSPEITVSTAGIENENTYRLEYSSLDNTSPTDHLIVECLLDNEKLDSCSSPIVLSDLVQENHELRILVTDLAGNQKILAHEWIQQGGKWDLQFQSKPSSLTNRTNADFVFRAQEIGKSGIFSESFQCALDEGITSKCGSDIGGGSYYVNYENLTEGTHKLKVTALSKNDAVLAVKTIAWIIDTTPPSTKILEILPDSIRTTTVEVKYSATDKNGVASYYCDGLRPTGGCQPPFIYQRDPHFFSPGILSVGIQAIDSAGNRSEKMTLDLNFVVPENYGGTPVGEAFNIQLVGTQAYVLFENGVAIFELEKFEEPRLTRFINTDQFRKAKNFHFFVDNSFVYVSPGVLVLDISNNEEVVHVSNLNYHYYVNEFYKIGNRLAIADDRGLHLYQIDNSRPVFKVQNLPGLTYSNPESRILSWARSKDSIVSMLARVDVLDTVSVDVIDITQQPGATVANNIKLPVTNSGSIPRVDLRSSDDYLVVLEDLMPGGTQYPDKPKVRFRVFDPKSLPQLSEIGRYDLNNEIRPPEFEISNDVLITIHLSKYNSNPWLGVFSLKENFRQLNTINNFDRTTNSCDSHNDITTSGDFLFVSCGPNPRYNIYNVGNPLEIVKGGSVPQN